MQDAFNASVVAADGFLYKPDRPNAQTKVAQKWGVTGNTISAWVELQFHTLLQSQDAQQGAPAPEQNATVLLGYMKSYASMGTAKVTCVAGCVCEPNTFSGKWDLRVTLRSFHRFEVRAATGRVHARHRAAGPGGESTRLRARPTFSSNHPCPLTPRPQATQHPACRVRVTILPETETDGHKITITSITITSESKDVVNKLRVWDDHGI